MNNPDADFQLAAVEKLEKLGEANHEANRTAVLGILRNALKTIQTPQVRDQINQVINSWQPPSNKPQNLAALHHAA
jgi:hypothetical protein